MSYGTSVTCLANMIPEGISLQCECAKSAARHINEYKVRIDGPGEESRTEAVLVAGDGEETRARIAATVPSGKTLLLHCGRNADGQDVIVMVTPHIAEGMLPDSAMAVPAPTFRGQIGVDKMEDPPIPLPLGRPCCSGTPSCMTNSLPACSTCPAPMPPPLVQVATTEPQGEPLLAKFMAKYRQACAVGDKAKAQAYADCCLAIDPTCFQK
jgi:hypothetical protein